jgi:hypothetical protein
VRANHGAKVTPARPAIVVAVTAMAAACAVLIIIAGAPIATDDLWWHLKAGEMYAEFGPWVDVDVMLHTAAPHAPVPHEWLFAVVVHLVEQEFGFYGVRLLHASLVVLALAFFHGLVRQANGGALAAAAALTTFAIVAVPRLVQFRPDLFSIIAVLIVVRALRMPLLSARVVTALAVLTMVWANMHSLVLIGLNLTLAMLLGRVLHDFLARFFLSDTPPDLRLSSGVGARLWLVTLGVMFLAALCNPRGLNQLTTFIVSTSETAIWHITDEWSVFNPFRRPAPETGVGTLQWIVADAVIAGFLTVAVMRVIALVKYRTWDRLAAFDARGFGLGCAGLVAMCVSTRFLWLAILPLLYIVPTLNAWARVGAGRWLLAAGAVTAAANFSLTYYALDIVVRFRDDPGAYFYMPYRSHKYFAEGVRFLREARVQGNAYNAYWMGGFLGFWLAPDMKTFIDGRTEHYTYETYLDYSSVLQMKGARRGESHVDVLDRTGVTVFFGVGFPRWWYGVNTTNHLAKVPGWILVSRSYRHAIYLRIDSDSASSPAIDRIVAHYAASGITFEREAGLDVERIIREQVPWAIEKALLPMNYPELVSAASASSHPNYLWARARLALVYALNGAYGLQVDLDQDTLAHPDAPLVTRQRLVLGLLRLGRPEQARGEADRLYRLDAELGQEALTWVRTYVDIDRRGGAGPDGVRYRAILHNRLLGPILPASDIDIWSLEHDMCTETPCPAPTEAGPSPPGRVRASEPQTSEPVRLRQSESSRRR